MIRFARTMLLAVVFGAVAVAVNPAQAQHREDACLDDVFDVYRFNVPAFTQHEIRVMGHGNNRGLLPSGASTGVLQATPGSRSAFHSVSPVAGSTASRYEYVRRVRSTTTASPVSSTELPTPWLPPSVPYSAPSLRCQTVFG